MKVIKFLVRGISYAVAFPAATALIALALGAIIVGTLYHWASDGKEPMLTLLVTACAEVLWLYYFVNLLTAAGY